MEKKIVIEEFHALCCPYIFHKGQKLEIVRQPSKNRLYINAYEMICGKLQVRGSHNVKKSTFFRCCKDDINENTLLS